jgi:hypothetical protein
MMCHDYTWELMICQGFLEEDVLLALSCHEEYFSPSWQDQAFLQKANQMFLQDHSGSAPALLENRMRKTQVEVVIATPIFAIELSRETDMIFFLR